MADTGAAFRAWQNNRFIAKAKSASTDAGDTSLPKADLLHRFMIALLVAALPMSSSSAGPVVIKKYMNLTPSQTELLRLPKFCWHTFTASHRGAGYNIPKQSCGPGMNHYCPGLLRKLRADDPLRKKSDRIQLYKQALADVNYTLRWMKDYPSCFIRKHALTTQAQIKGSLQFLRMSPR